MKNKILCFFYGHIPISVKRKKDIKKTIFLLDHDIIGISALSNIKKIEELNKEYLSCQRCGYSPYE